jgi:hypothetical protein
MNPKFRLSRQGKRIRFYCIALAFLIFIGFLIFRKRDNGGSNIVKNTPLATAAVTPVTYIEPTHKPLIQSVARTDVNPDESGKIMVVMFHSFVEQFTPTASNSGEYVMTFNDLRDLLKTLYDKNYRPISMKDYLDNEINLSQGYTPIVFTFDDGTSGQFNLIQKDGKLVANPNSAVGVFEQFNSEHPDFNLQGTFYVNMSANVFKGEGTLEDRLRYLLDRGFEIGNHTYSHVDFNDVTTQAKVEEEIGKNQKEIDKIIPGYKMETLSLPSGHMTKDTALHAFIMKGSFDGLEYENKAIMLVGAEPSEPVGNVAFNPLKVPRVRASGVKKDLYDLNWWLTQGKIFNYISDGNPDAVTVPTAKESKVNKDALKGRQLKTY